MKKNVLFFMLGVILSGVTVYALSADQITYTDTNNVEKTVDTALDDLYDKVEDLTPELLWTNPSPTASFSAQTVSLDLSDYKYVIIVSGANNYNYSPKSNVIVPVGNYTYSSSMGLTNQRQSRNVKATSTGITFAQAYWGGEVDNGTVIPYKIYGIKGDIAIDIGLE